MPVTEFRIPYHNDQSFFACEWSPSGASRGLILLIHGLSDHTGRYHHVGTFFAAAGYTMIVVDLRGHGRSFGARGHFPSFELVMDDISLYLEVARRRHPHLALFLYGHSMGGNLVLNHLIRHAPNVAGAIVTSPWLRLNVKPQLYKAILATLANKIFPSMAHPDGIIPSYLSHDEEVGKRYMTDPLVHHLITVRTYLEISHAGDFALEHAGRINCPLLLMHGDDDHLTDFTASAECSGKIVSPHAFKPWKGLYHELHNEFEQLAILEFVEVWINSVNSQTPVAGS
jgi:alpha-beta hydrolase superfamily lysophospholipase